MSFYRAFERVLGKKAKRSSSSWVVEGISKAYRDSGFPVLRVGTQYTPFLWIKIVVIHGIGCVSRGKSVPIVFQSWKFFAELSIVTIIIPYFVLKLHRARNID